MWTLYFTKQAQKDAGKLASSGLKTKAQQLLTILQSDPWQNPPPFEKLVGDLSGAFSGNQSPGLVTHAGRIPAEYSVLRPTGFQLREPDCRAE